MWWGVLLLALFPLIGCTGWWLALASKPSCVYRKRQEVGILSTVVTRSTASARCAHHCTSSASFTDSTENCPPYWPQLRAPLQPWRDAPMRQVCARPRPQSDRPGCANCGSIGMVVAHALT